MPVKKRNELYELFTTGNKPTQDDFVDLIDSAINIAEDGIGISEKGKPMEIIQQGEKRRLLDFSSAKDNPVWRINALSDDGIRNGLNFVANNNSRLFINQGNGFTGINTDEPEAQLHIVSESGAALRIEDPQENPSLTIDADGNIGIGTNAQSTSKVAVGGKVHFQDEAVIDKLVHAKNGVTVDGAALTANNGVSIKKGATVETGLLLVKSGLTISGGSLNASTGAIAVGSALEAQKGLSVADGATIRTGELKAMAGATVSGAELKAEDGLTVTDGATIQTGELKAMAGATVSGVELKAEDGLTVRRTTTLYDGVFIETGLLTAKEGLSVTNSSAFHADGQVTLGNENAGAVTVNGELVANKGISIISGELTAGEGVTVNGSKLQANEGLTVYKGATIETGTLSAKGGISVTGGLTVDGAVTLGNASGGDVTATGLVKVNAGAEVTGDVSITGGLNVTNDTTLGNATIQALDVTDITIAGTIGLQTVDLDSLTSDTATIGNLTSGDLTVSGLVRTSNNVNFAGNVIYMSYQGPTSVLPKLKVQKGTVPPKVVYQDDIEIHEVDHFTIAIDGTKQVTITYDEDSDINRLMEDWADYQTQQPILTKGFYLNRFGSCPWTPQDMEIGFSTGKPFKYYTITDKGLRIIYTGAMSGEPQFEIKANEDLSAEGFGFAINGLTLVVKYSNNTVNCSVSRLLADWQAWKNTNLASMGEFDIQRIATIDSTISDTSHTLDVTSTDESFYQGTIRTNLFTIGGNLQFDGSRAVISGISCNDLLGENSDTTLPTQRAVKTYIDKGLAPKVDKIYVDETVASKVSEAVAPKADKTYVNETITSKVSEAVAPKADKTYVNETITSKVSEAVAPKADVDYVNGELTKKAGLIKINDVVIATGSTAIITDITVDTGSRGLIMVLIKKGSDSSILGTGLFAVHGSNIITKIAGEGMTDQKNGGTINIYYDAAGLTVQNTNVFGVIATITYFGA